MKKSVFATTLIIAYSTISAQTTKDTIDYSSIIFDKTSRPTYAMNKVTSGPKSEIIDADYNNGLALRVMLYSDDKRDWTKAFSIFKNNANYKTSDTIVYLEFDMEKYNKPFNKHQWGIIHFHRNNIITIDKIRESVYMRREFKVIKWTKNEIILKDNSLKYLNRTYYLKKI